MKKFFVMLLLVLVGTFGFSTFTKAEQKIVTGLEPSSPIIYYTSYSKPLKFTVRTGQPPLNKRLCIRWYKNTNSGELVELTNFRERNSATVNCNAETKGINGILVQVLYYEGDGDLDIDIDFSIGEFHQWNIRYRSYGGTNQVITEENDDVLDFTDLAMYNIQELIPKNIVDQGTFHFSKFFRTFSDGILGFEDRIINNYFSHSPFHVSIGARNSQTGEITMYDEYDTNDIDQAISGVTRNSCIKFNFSYTASTYDSSGDLVNATINFTRFYQGFLIEVKDLVESFHSDLPVGFPFVRPGKYNFSVIGSPNAKVKWQLDGSDYPGNSIEVELPERSNRQLLYRIEQEAVAPIVWGSWYEEYYMIYTDAGGMNLQTPPDYLAMPSIDYLNCSTPYSMGNGVTVDLKTGDAKVGRVDLVLPGRNGLELRLQRVFSAEANMISKFYSNSGSRYWVNRHTTLLPSLTEDPEKISEYEGPWVQSLPWFNTLKIDPSESILTEPMPGWSYDLPRVTPYFIYCDGRLYPNCLEADRRLAGIGLNFLWAQGCDKSDDIYYYRSGKFKLKANGDNEVVLMKPDGTSYIFPCEKKVELGGWTYSPLSKITDSSGNSISFTYGAGDVTITDSVGRKVIVNSGGISVNDVRVVSFEVQYGNPIDTYDGTIDYESITYITTDAVGRQENMVMGMKAIDLTSASGETTHLDFDAVNCDDPTHIWGHDEIGMRLIGGESQGRSFTVDYEFDTQVIGYDQIAAITLNYGSETTTASYVYKGLETSDGEIYSSFCPGPSAVTGSPYSYNFTYEEQSLSSGTARNSQYSRVSSIGVMGPFSYTRSFAYDDDNNVSRETGPDGAIDYGYYRSQGTDNYITGINSISQGNLTTTYGYDGQGRVTSVTRSDTPTIQYGYDMNGNISTIIDPNGNVTTITYDTTYSLFPKTVTNGQRTVHYEYVYPFGWVSSKSFGPYTSSYTYDGIGRVLSLSDSSGTTTMSYSNLAATTADDEGNTAVDTYDVYGRLINSHMSSENGFSTQTHYGYDPQYMFRIASIAGDDFTQNYSYSGTDLTVTDSDGNSVKTNYDAMGRSTQIISNIVKGDTPGTQTQSFTYINGILTGATQTMGSKSSTYHYSSRGLVTDIGYNDGKNETFSYDSNGNPLTFKDRDNRIFSYEYNQYDEVTQVKLSNNVIAAFSYDNLGRMETITSPDISYRNYYLDKHLSHSERTIKGRLYDLYYQYGDHDRVTGLTLKDGQGRTLTQFGYTYASTKATVLAMVNGEMKEFAALTTGSNGIVTHKTLGNGLALDFQFDSQKRLKDRKVTNGLDILQTHHYGYDGAGNITKLDVQTFQYDSNNRLTAASGGGYNLNYQYDATGHRTTETKNGINTRYVYEGDLLRQNGDTFYQYNNHGSRTVKSKGTDHWEYIYDGLGRLTSVRFNDNQLLGRYGYDESNWRIWKEENGKTQIYIRQAEQVLFQETFSGTNVNESSVPEANRTYVYLGNELVGTVRDGTEARYYINDHLGTTELVTDRNGMIKTQIEHSPFGDMVTGGTSVRIEKAINSAGFDPNNTSAIVANGQARPVKSVTEYEQLLYRFNDLTGTSDPHFSTAKEYVYNHNNPDILQLKVVSSLTYAGSNGPVEKIEYLDLTDKPLGQYKIALDFRKDVGGNISTLNDKFEIYISRVNIYSQSQVQTMPIAVEPGTTSFTFAPQGIGLTNVTWLYSQDNGNSWDNIVPGTNTALPNGTGNILIKAIFSPGFYPESPVLNGFKVTFVSTGNGDSEDYFFTGKEKDVTGLYYFGARYYDPEIGRFITEDPGQDGEDWFGYCGNNPVGYFDPDGLAATAAKYPNGQILPYKKPWFRTTWLVGDLYKETGDLIMLVTLSDDNLLTGEHYLPGDRLDAAFNAFLSAGLSWAGGELWTKSPTGIKFLAKFKIEGHHLLPRQFKQFFEAAGLNIEKYKTPLIMLKHRGKIFGIHVGVHPEWNKMWAEFFAKNGFNVTKEEILEQLDKMLKKFFIGRN